MILCSSITATASSGEDDSADCSDLVPVLDFSLNDFIGIFPTGFGACSNLQVLSMGFNKLTGTIPIDIDGARSLQVLSFPGNNLTGEIDESITNLTNLRSVTTPYG
ncbi:hypothetical protein LXL04_011742 [Taraxacum kok-saghyz]